MLKLSDNPPIIHPLDALDAPQEAPWWVGHTKSRFEKAFAWEMHKRQVAYFLPMVERITISGGKKRKVLTPLFAGYVFFSGPAETRYEALLTDRLCQVIEVPEQEQLVRELADIHNLLRNRAMLDLYAFAVVGSRCQIRSGPFQGMEGTVVSRNNGKARFVLQVTTLGQATSVEIDADLLDPVEESVNTRLVVAADL